MSNERAVTVSRGQVEMRAGGKRGKSRKKGRERKKKCGNESRKEKKRKKRENSVLATGGNEEQWNRKIENEKCVES